MTTVLATAGLSGGYGNSLVVRDLHLQVAAGEMVACFGVNGAGKTTLLRALSGALPVVQGEVTLQGIDVGRQSTWSRVRAGMAHVPEGRHVFKGMTVRENLDVGALASREPWSVDEAYSLFPRLYERRDQAAGTLSGGEQQMVAIGRALMGRPAVLLIDEMSAGLAPVMTDRLVDGLVQVRQSGVAILLIEQAPHFVADVVDRVYLLERGAIIGEGTIASFGGAAGIGDHYLGISVTAGAATGP